MVETIERFLEVSGPFIYFNVIVLFIAIFYATTWLWKLHWQGRISGIKFIAYIDQILESNTLSAAMKACEPWKGASVPRVLEAGFRATPDGEPAIKDAVHFAELKETSQALRGLSILPSLANIAVLLGLIGTVHALSYAFMGRNYAVGMGGNPQALLTVGISEAMNHTAFGLLVAIICTVAQLGIQSLTRSVVSDVMLTSHYVKEKLKERQAWFGILDTPTDSRAPVIPQIAPHPAS